jgi:hypothetical protein
LTLFCSWWHTIPFFWGRYRSRWWRTWRWVFV